MKTFALLALLLAFAAYSSNAVAGVTKLEAAVTDTGFEPASFEVPAGTPVELTITRKSDHTCATQVVVPSKGIKKELPLDKPVTLKLGKLNKGEIKFGCQMAMMVGAVISVK